MFYLRILSLAIAGFVATAAAPASASSHYRPYPLVKCGPDSAYLCKLRGSFADTPFHYNLAIYPGCLKPVRSGRRGGGWDLVVVCGSPDRQMIW
jgi:hypothetical protein